MDSLPSNLPKAPTPFRCRALAWTCRAREQNNDLLAFRRVVHAVTRARVDPQFAHAFANRPHVAWIAIGQATNSHVNPSASFQVAQGFQPSVEGFGSDDLRHGLCVTYILQPVKQISG
jgi:hypothetical protein